MKSEIPCILNFQFGQKISKKEKLAAKLSNVRRRLNFFNFSRRFFLFLARIGIKRSEPFGNVRNTFQPNNLPWYMSNQSICSIPKKVLRITAFPCSLDSPRLQVDEIQKLFLLRIPPSDHQPVFIRTDRFQPQRVNFSRIIRPSPRRLRRCYPPDQHRCRQERHKDDPAPPAMKDFGHYLWEIKTRMIRVPSPTLHPKHHADYPIIPRASLLGNSPRALLRSSQSTIFPIFE